MAFNPQTPQSPSQSSPSTSDPMTNFTSSVASIATTLPTPAHSINGSSLTDMAHDTTSADDSPQKRKRTLDDLGEAEPERKKAHIEDSSVGIHDMHLDVGTKYLLCRTPHPASRPRLSDDFIAKFNLSSIAGEVARVLPNGEKNAIRKTYKGHIKRLGVQGHFDSVKSDPANPDPTKSFLSLVRLPADVYHVHHCSGKEIQRGFGPETLHNLRAAMSMAKGAISKDRWDPSVLGELGPGNPTKTEKQIASAKPTAPGTPIPSNVANARSKPALGAAQEAMRPRRAGKKRSYGDSSFEGYGDGFPDDYEGNGSGYSTGEGEAGQLKRRKKNPAVSSPYNIPRQPSYGPGMVGR